MAFPCINKLVCNSVLSAASGEGHTCSQCPVYTVYQPVFYRDEQGRQTAVTEECLCFVLWMGAVLFVDGE